MVGSTLPCRPPSRQKHAWRSDRENGPRPEEWPRGRTGSFRFLVFFYIITDMNIHIKTKDLDLTEPLKEWVNEKIGGLEKYLEKVQEQGEVLCEVEVSRATKHHKKGDVFYAEVILHLPGRRMRAEEQGYDIRVALDKVRDRLQRDIEKYKNKEGLTGKALRHMARLGRGTAGAAKKILWWRNK